MTVGSIYNQTLEPVVAAYDTFGNFIGLYGANGQPITITGSGISSATTLQLSSNSPTPSVSTTVYGGLDIINQSANITSVSTTGSTPALDTPFLFSITPTANITISWGSQFANGNASLPTGFLAGVKTTVGFLWSTAAAAWLCVSGGGIQNTTIVTTRISNRVLSIVGNTAAPSINTDSYDETEITGQTTTITSITMTGTPQVGDRHTINITGNGTSFTLGVNFEASGTIALPTATTSTNKLSMIFKWNTATSKWRIAGYS
jgi:hypothetical protein